MKRADGENRYVWNGMNWKSNGANLVEMRNWLRRFEEFSKDADSEDGDIADN